jgi:uncharacterized protein with HEPN domain
MRERVRDKGRLEDIVEHCINVTMLIEGYSLEELIADKRTYYAVMKNVEIVGEASYMLTKAFKEAHPNTPWKVVQGMRHVLVHDYANIVSETLYDTAINSIPELRKQVERYLDDTDWDAWEATEEPTETDKPEAKDSIMNIVQKMKAKGYPIEDIADITGLSLEVIKEL